MPHICIAYSTVEGQTGHIAQFLAERLRERGCTARLLPVPEQNDPPTCDESADGIILAASVHVGRHSAAAVRFASNDLQRLNRLPTAFLSVSLSAATEGRAAEARSYVSDFLAQTGWQPTLHRTVAGALRYTRYGFMKRLLLRGIAKQNGLPTDTSRDHELTDWEDVLSFLDAFLSYLQPAGSPAGAS